MNVAVIPTPAAIEAAWDNYCSLMQAALEHQELLVNCSYMMDVARAHKAWQDAFLAVEAP